VGKSKRRLTHTSMHNARMVLAAPQVETQFTFPYRCLPAFTGPMPALWPFLALRPVTAHLGTLGTLGTFAARSWRVLPTYSHTEVAVYGASSMAPSLTPVCLRRQDLAALASWQDSQISKASPGVLLLYPDIPSRTPLVQLQTSTVFRLHPQFMH
jgi:hypothetical protein